MSTIDSLIADLTALKKHMHGDTKVIMSVYTGGGEELFYVGIPSGIDGDTGAIILCEDGFAG